MTLRNETFEGQPSGTTITTSNSSFNVVTTSGTVVGEFSSAQAAHGTKSGHISGGASSTFYPRHAGMSAASAACRVYIYLPTAISTAMNIIEVRDTAGATIAAVGVATDGKTPQVKGKPGTVLQNLTVMTLGAWYRFEIQVAKGTGTTDGTLKVQQYSLDSTTPLSTYSSTTTDVGTVNVGTFVAGKLSSSPVAEMYIDDMAANDGTTTPIGPVLANTKPTANAGATQIVEVGAAVSQVGSDSDTDGTVASRSWTVVDSPGTAPTLTGATTNTVSFTPTAQGRYTLRYVVTDDLGTSSDPSDVTIYVYPHSGDTVTLYSATLGAWTKYGSAATTVAGLSDGDPTTGIKSPLNPSNEQCSGVFNPFGPGSIEFTVSGQYGDAPVSRTVTVYKEDGTTQIYQTVQTPAASNTPLPVTLSSTALAAVPTLTDRKALVVTVKSAVV